MQRPSNPSTTYSWIDAPDVDPPEWTPMGNLAHSFFDGRTNLAEWYFPTRLVLDVSAVRGLDTNSTSWQAGEGLRAFVEAHGESVAFCGDPALQLSAAETELVGTKPVICLKTATAAFTAIVEQGEGASESSRTSHFARFHDMRDELVALRAANAAFQPAYPAATNPVLRPPIDPRGRVWIENEEAAAVVPEAGSRTRDRRSPCTTGRHPSRRPHGPRSWLRCNPWRRTRGSS